MKRWKKSLIWLVVLAVFVVGYFGIQSLNKPAATVTEESGVFALTDKTVDDLTALSWTSGETTCSLTRADGAWSNANDPVFPVDQEKAQTLADDLLGLTATRKLDDIQQSADYGLAEPSFTVTASWSDGSSTAYQLGSATPFADGYYLALSGQDGTAYTVATSLADMFASTMNDLAAWETLPTIGTVVHFQLGNALDAVREETSRTVNPDQHWYAADGTALDGVDDLVTAAQSLTFAALETASASADDLAAWALDDETAMRLVLTDDTGAECALLLGGANDVGDRYVRLPASAMVYTVASADVADLLDASAESLRSKVILSLSWAELQSAVLTLPGGAVTLQPETGDADETTDDADTSPEEALWEQLTALTATDFTDAAASGEPLLTVEVTAASGVTDTLVFSEYDADSYLLTRSGGAVLVPADGVDRIVRAARQLLP